MNRKVRSALALFPTDNGRQWHRFTHPVDTITAWNLDEVVPALEQVSAASAEGLWVVGAVSYDAGPAFDAAIEARRNRSTPLAVFGIFPTFELVERPAGGDYTVSEWTASQTRAEFERSVLDIKSPIRRGDTYQVNHTMRLRADFVGDPLGFFARMASAQQAEYATYVDLGSAAICSASPELFFSLDGRTILTKPMKGTRGRSLDPDRDAQLRDELRSSLKDLAENTMIVDMARNDLGRIAELGSVETPELHRLETYPTVHQMTSSVTAKTDASLAELFGALFPAASVTGAPKISTSKIITSLEPHPRGVYTGAVGVVSPHGTTEFNVAIRTAWIDLDDDTAEYGVGCGIVWDSQPDEEWDEAKQKSLVLRRCKTDLRLLETMRWTPTTGCVLLDEHLDRLSATARYFDFACDTDQIRDTLDRLHYPTDHIIRLLVDESGDSKIEEQPIAPTDVERSFGLTPPTTLTDAVIRFDDRPVDRSEEFLYHKTTDRSTYEEAIARRVEIDQAYGQDATYDVLLWNSFGQITETTRGNIVIEQNERLLTPPMSAGLLPGTFRHYLLGHGAITESELTLAAVLQASNVYVINSVRGWVRVTIDPTSVPQEMTS